MVKEYTGLVMLAHTSLGVSSPGTSPVNCEIYSQKQMDESKLTTSVTSSIATIVIAW